MDTTPLPPPPPPAPDTDDLRWLLFSLQGRIGRKTWWLWGVGAMLGLGLLLTALLGIAGVHEKPRTAIVNLALLWPTLALSAKRWHDRDKSAWWLLIGLVPVLGQLWTFIENGLLAGTPGRNRFGEPPINIAL
jgi:uncharacterized membrane protein YhaH (DUF805 family)